MPWKASRVVNERMRFVWEQESGLHSMTELCAIYNIARETGYYWLRRYRQGGLEALQDRGRAAHQHPHETPEEIAAAVRELRRGHMSWGPRKLKRVLEREEPQRVWPASSTIGALLAREGLVVARKKRRRTALHTTVCGSRCAEPRVVRGFQRLVSDRRWAAHRPMDDHRCLQPLAVALPASAQDQRPASAGDFRIGVSRMRPAGSDSHR
jgi:transposase